MGSQCHDSMLAPIWNILKELHITQLPTIPPIDTTLLLVRDWLRAQFSYHPQLDNALATIQMLDSTPSSAFLRRNNINPDDILRLTWSLVFSRPATYELFFETLLEAKENMSSHAPIIRLLQLAWALSPIFPAVATTNHHPIKPLANGTSSSIRHDTHERSPLNSLQTTQPHQPTSPLNEPIPSTTTSPQPLMSLYLDDSSQPSTNTSFTTVPLMSFHVPPLRQPNLVQPKRLYTTSHRPRLYSDVCRQPPTNPVSFYTTASHPRLTYHRRHTNPQQQPDLPPSTTNIVNPSTSQSPTIIPSNDNPPSPDLTSAFNTELIELS